MRVKALQAMYYDKVMRQVGEEYEMDDREEGEAKILATIGKIEVLERKQQKPEEPTPPPKYEAAALTSEPAAEEQQPERRRYYRRRDMRPEE